MKKLFIYFGNMKFRTKLVLSYIILITIPLCIIGFRYYAVSTDVISDIAKKNVYEIVKKNNEVIDTKLSQVQESIFSCTVDKELYNTFSSIKPDSDYSILLMEGGISNVLSKYFVRSQDIYSAQLATSYYTFNPRATASGTAVKSFIPQGAFIKSRLYKVAKQGDGKLQWVPTYDFADMFDVEYIKEANIDYRYMFSAVEMVNSSVFDGNNYFAFDSGIERPVIIVNFKEDFYQKAFRNSIPIEGSYYFITTKDGQIVSHQDQSKISTYMSIPWLEDIVKKGSGTDTIAIDGKQMIICYDTSSVTGWISVVVIPPDRLLDQILPTLKLYTVYAAIILIFISIIVSYFITGRITKPIQKLTRATKKIGEGNFNEKIQEEGSSEFKELIHKFNGMNEKIQKLIEENYESKIKEKEAEITALNLQLDPHFMYNTLNLINLISAENGQDEISEMIMSLSKMLKYTVKNRKDIVPYSEDMEYLKGYIYIMAKRFEGKFSVECNIEEELNDYSVPKFFMQPFVENSLVHGFSSIKTGGVLKINCWIEKDIRYFCIEDNGNGISAEKIHEITRPETGSVGINNVDKRIKIIYGEEFGVKIQSELGKGTRVTITLPFGKSEKNT